MLFRGIRIRLLGLVLATVIPFTALIAVGLWTQWRNDEAAAMQRSVNEARTLAAQVDDHISNLQNLLVGLSAAVSLDRAATRANDALLERVSRQLPGYVSNLLLFTPDGRNIGSSESATQRRPDGLQRSYFHRALQRPGFAMGDVFRGSQTGRFVVNIAHRIEDQSGQVHGVLAAGTWLELFQDVLRIGDLPAGSVFRIVDEHGVVIAQSVDGPSWIGRVLDNGEFAARHLDAKQMTEVIPWSDGIDRITGSATAHNVPWLVSVGLPTDMVFAAVISRLAWSALFALAAFIAASAIAWMWSGRIVQPLRQLGKDASVLAAGKLRHRTAVHSRDEVGALAENFNRMADSLEWRQEEVNRAVDELRHAKDTLSAVIDASPVAIICSDLNRRLVLWNRAAEQMFGYSAEEVLGLPSKLLPPEGAQEAQKLHDRALSGEILRNVEIRRLRKDGTLIDVRVAAAPMYHPDGSVRGVARAYEDITHRKRAEEQLRRVAHYDQLTGLPNRLSLQKELGRLLADRQRLSTTVALFDLDGFKDVNDTLGHSTGDELLIEVAHRLTVAATADSRIGQICRLGGDEFVVVIPDCGDPRTAAEIIDSISKGLSEPYSINDHIVHLCASAGIALAPNDGASVDELIANADLALYQAKGDGGRTYRFFLPVLRAQAQARRSLGVELRRAFAENEFEMFYQPQLRLSDNSLVGAEALLRWRHPARGILAPGAFIEALSESALAPEMGRWIIRTVCEAAARWRGMGLPLDRVAINLFPAQAKEDRIVQDVEEILADTGLPVDALELEITENAAFDCENPDAPLQKLHDKGIKLAFDDFGTGYASLNHLARFPVWRIKIDRSFVARITESVEDAAIVRSLIAMAHNLGLEVIAEGVETQAQASFLIRENCEEAQGFLYAKPLPEAEFERYLEAAKFPRNAAAEEAAVTAAPVRVTPLRRRRVRKA
jgi:diguanylate cyclase (GGDEF)-like protein/PAS domain S-box-containing protein